jgi:hypothetical protein
MIGKSPNQSQINLVHPLLKVFINMNHKLVQLADNTDVTLPHHKLHNVICNFCVLKSK